MSDDQIVQALAGHLQRNALLKQALVDKNVDIDRQRPIDIHFWTPSQHDAAVLARELYKKGFLVKLIASSGDGNRWSVEAGALIVPEEILGDEFTEAMVRLAD